MEHICRAAWRDCLSNLGWHRIRQNELDHDYPRRATRVSALEHRPSHEYYLYSRSKDRRFRHKYLFTVCSNHGKSGHAPPNIEYTTVVDGPFKQFPDGHQRNPNCGLAQPRRARISPWIPNRRCPRAFTMDTTK